MKNLKASFTVEGSVVIGICMIIIGMCIMLGFDMYKETILYIEKTEVKDMDTVDIFKKINVVEEFTEDIFDR